MRHLASGNVVTHYPRSAKPQLAASRFSSLILAGAMTLSLPIAARAERPPALELPLLVIGASWAEGKTPFNNGIAPLGGTSVGFGSYLSLGQALTRENKLPGYVINEAEAGARLR